ncbi:molybdate ABC transporter substrate-binding protein [Sphingomonas sp.]|uniref:molybdate ABC transporter substrate-binding protein n=1 Tax=Sphingomonas sp. TaxID=28214 RepID=UPI0025F709AE|nr:molybdate ABC transporter substrate-binding protein [Sphingomonas sp.]
MIQPFTRRLVLAGLAALSIGAGPSPRAPVILAAASLQESLTAAADVWARAGHPRPVISFAASSTLARQIEAGAPGDLFVSADEEWMDALAAKGLLAPGTRADLVGNRLVVVEPAGRHSSIPTSGPRLARVLGAGPLAMADPDSVPAGKYGKTALEKLGAWTAVAPNIVRAENVRAALALVERGAAPFGIVYLTDAKASSKVRVAGVFPPTSHPPILYPVARLARSTNPDAEGFRRFLLSPRGRAIFARFGFGVPAK